VFTSPKRNRTGQTHEHYRHSSGGEPRNAYTTKKEQNEDARTGQELREHSSEQQFKTQRGGKQQKANVKSFQESLAVDASKRHRIITPPMSTQARTRNSLAWREMETLKASSNSVRSNKALLHAYLAPHVTYFAAHHRKKKKKRQKKSIETAGVTDREGGAASTRQAESSDTAAAQSSPARAHGQGEGTLGRGVVVGQLFVDANEHREKPTRTKQTQRSRTKTMLSRYRRHPSV
jgi:hypothetical protein